jgi:hypothetical protein
LPGPRWRDRRRNRAIIAGDGGHLIKPLSMAAPIP